MKNNIKRLWVMLVCVMLIFSTHTSYAATKRFTVKTDSVTLISKEGTTKAIVSIQVKRALKLKTSKSCKVTSSKTKVASVVSKGKKITILAKKTGKTVVTLKRNKYSTVKITVNVLSKDEYKNLNSLSISEKNITIEEGSGYELNTNAKSTLIANVNNTAVATAKVSGSKVVITGIKAGIASLDVYYKQNTTVKKTLPIVVTAKGKTVKSQILKAENGTYTLPCRDFDVVSLSVESINKNNSYTLAGADYITLKALIIAGKVDYKLSQLDKAGEKTLYGTKLYVKKPYDNGVVILGKNADSRSFAVKAGAEKNTLLVDDVEIKVDTDANTITVPVNATKNNIVTCQYYE